MAEVVTETDVEAVTDAGLVASKLLEDSAPEGDGPPGPGMLYPEVEEGPGRGPRASVSERDWHAKPLLLQNRHGGSEVMTQAVLRRRHASQGLFLRLLG
jgi:hypothetical protein